MDTATTQTEGQQETSVIEHDSAVVRLAGDSGDGMQLVGMLLTNTSALLGNDIATFPDFPAEIRAPKGTPAGVSGFQLHFSAQDIHTPGDRVDALVAMNPAALKVNLASLRPQGVLIVDEDAFSAKGLKLAGYQQNPLDDESLNEYRLIRVPISSLTRSAVQESRLSRKLATRCRNFFVLGLVYWLYGRDTEATLRFIKSRFENDPEVAHADRLALLAGRNYGETTEALTSSYHVPPARLPAGRYRNLTGNQAMAYGLITAAKLSHKSLFFGSYPITPASDILHELSRHKRFGVRTFQAEDEIAAATAAIGAAFGGAMAVTASSGPGIALKSEALGLAVMLELPLIVLDVQRAGPSTGLPTKPEQSDLLQVLYGRSGEAPLPVLAACCPSDCFQIVRDAWRIATQLMTPVVVLSDAYIANAAEPWRIPENDELQQTPIDHPTPKIGSVFMPYARNELLARPWALPGTKGLMHRIGGLEKENITGNVSYDPQNHDHMVQLRAHKIENAVNLIPRQEISGAPKGRLLVLSWGGTFGACAEAVARAQYAGAPVSHTHLRYLHPMPANLDEILRGFDQVLIPELNTGQLRRLIREKFLLEVIGLNKISGRPFTVTEIADKIDRLLKQR